MTKRPKLSKAEKRIQHLEGLLLRRKREVEDIRSRCDEDVAKVERRNKFTQFQIDSLKKGEWPL